MKIGTSLAAAGVLVIASGASLGGSSVARVNTALAPVQVDVVHAPESSSDLELAFATWALAIGTIVLCIITGVGVRRQGKDMQRSLDVAEASADAARRSADAAGRSAIAASDAVEAAARQRRDELERAVNSAAHRVIAIAARVDQLAKEVPGAAKTLFALAGHRDVASKAAPYESTMHLRQKAAADAITAGGIQLGALDRRPPDSELMAGLREMDKRLVNLELMKEDVTHQLESLNSQIEFQRQQNEARLQGAGGRIPPTFPGM